MNIIQSTIVALLFITMCNPLYANRHLDGQTAQKLEIRHSMMGFRNTLLFYTFKGQQAILQLSIANNDESFPVTAKIHLFDKKTTEKGLKKWINNQHSDGRYPNIPTPIFTHVLPSDSCTVTSHKQTGTTQNPGPGGGTFKNFAVTLSIKAIDTEEKFKLAAFTDTAQVHVKK
ncbi:MAG: hypothetical protein KJO21_10965 [Verrucomicrobiae bacterium]|nr:hypothetical protein [Verrucomicrobiae bacterium]NNJ42806.1 hypothetical protein [Akkermansiaceae bacterium]